MSPGVKTEEENMKQLWVGMMAVACAASLAAAQTPSQTTPTRSSSQSAAKQVTVTGCVQRASASPSGATGTTGTTGASSAEPSFILTNASSGSSSSAAPGATGTSGTPSSYRLEGDDAKLTPHIGHKVEITGELDSMPSSSAPAGSSSSASAPKLKIDTVRMVAASCSE